MDPLKVTKGMGIAKNFGVHGRDSYFGSEFITLYRQERQVRNVGVSLDNSGEA